MILLDFLQVFIGILENQSMKNLEKLQGLEGKKFFSLCTSTVGYEKYTLYPQDTIEKKYGKFIDGWGCLGKEIFFPLNIFGGVNKVKPNEEDFKKGTEFLKKLIKDNP